MHSLPRFLLTARTTTKGKRNETTVNTTTSSNLQIYSETDSRKGRGSGQTDSKGCSGKLHFANYEQVETSKFGTKVIVMTNYL
jgi:hypothetical protein